MSPKTISSGAVQADVDVANALQPPTRGCDAGGGVHVVIPADFLTRIAAAQDVPGCSYARLDPGGSMFVSDATQAQVVGPNAFTSLPVPLRPQLALFIAKINAAS